MSQASHATARLRNLYSMVLRRNRAVAECHLRRPLASSGAGPVPAFEPLEPRVLLDGLTEQQAFELLNVSPALFVANEGQWADESVRFVFNGRGASVAHTDSGPVFELFRQGTEDGDAGQDGYDVTGSQGGAGTAELESLRFSASFDGANAVTPVGRQQAETMFNFLVGDSSSHRSNVPGYEVVAYEGLYDGIYLRTWGRRDHLKYEFHVAPGADWSQIAVSYENIDGLSIDEAGALHIRLPGDWGEVVDDTPSIYQVVDGQQVDVPGRYVLLSADSYGFEITGDLDPERELVIDPDLLWATYLGGNASDAGNDIAVDASGNSYVTGQIFLANWATPGACDTSYGGYGDVFVAKLSPDGSKLLYATYLGGTKPDWGYSIAVDASGNAYVTGYTESAGWATPRAYDTSLNGYNDPFVAKISPDGSRLLYATYLGGGDRDYGDAIAIDASGNAYVTGQTLSAGWATAGAYDTSYNGNSDAFVAEVNPDGSRLLFATYLGGSAADSGGGIALDASGNVYVTGQTFSAGWATPDAYDASYNGDFDAFVAKVSTDGSSLLYATYLGGNGEDRGYGIALDASGNAYVTGQTLSPGWATPGAYDASYNGDYDAFVAKLNVSPFTDIGAGLPGVRGRSLAWGDYDNDGDLDLALTGFAGVGNITCIYRNDGGAFADIGAALPGVNQCSLAWGDYDNDGDLDLALAGDTGNGVVSRIYRNDGGAFTEIASLTGVYSCSLAWGDYDNDGDLDLALAGDEGAGGRITRVYRNDGGTFTDIGAALPGVSQCSLAWGDYDKDGDLDLALSGDTGSGSISCIYRNDGGTFMDIGAELPGARRSSLAWGDYDNDGALDLALAGLTAGGEPISRIYRNDGGPFTAIGAGLAGVYDCSLAWGDYDNDGDLDLALAGLTAGGEPISRIYRNDGQAFTDIGAGLSGVYDCSLAWGDYDNDRDLDLALTGYTGSDGVGRIYRNGEGQFNAPPGAPTGLHAPVDGRAVTLAWSAASDAQTPPAGLSYNIRIGTSPGGQDVLAGLADASAGWRRLPAPGNAQRNLSWTIGDLPDGTYYWSVQAIDTAFAGSAWAPESRFLVGDVTPPAATSIWPHGLVSDLVDHIDVTFSEPIDPSTLTVENVRIVPREPVRIGGYDTTGRAYGVAVSGTRAYVADSTAGLQILDVSNPYAPMRLGGYNTSGNARGVAISGTLAYVADGEAGLQILDVSNPLSPVRLGGYDTSGDARGVALSGTLAYVADSDAGLQIIDVSNPSSPVRLGGFDTSGSAYGVTVAGGLAYVADRDCGLQIIGVSNPSSPVLLGGLDTNGYAWDVAVSGTLAYVADWDRGLQIIDVSHPSSPVLRGGYDTGGYAYGVAISGPLAYVADGGDGLQIIDVSDPALPVSLGGCDTSGDARSVVISGTRAYVPDWDSGLQVVQVLKEVAGLTPVDDVTYRIKLPGVLADGEYRVFVGPDVADLAGNTMDRDGDGIGGEPSDAHVFSVLEDSKPPGVPGDLFLADDTGASAGVLDPEEPAKDLPAIRRPARRRHRQAEASEGHAVGVARASRRLDPWAQPSGFGRQGTVNT